MYLENLYLTFLYGQIESGAIIENVFKLKEKFIFEIYKFLKLTFLK